MPDLILAALLGVVAGLIPVYLGLVPLWFMRNISERTRGLLVSFALGVLLFLFADVLGAAQQLSSSPGPNSLVFILGIVAGLSGPLLLARRRAPDASLDLRDEASRARMRFFTAYMISTGIGLHNLGEGLAIGAALSTGNLVLTSVLVVGFALHNGTEGFGIAAPIASITTRLKEPILLGLIAGFPTVVGSVIGSLAQSSMLSTLFFSVAAGAILYVVIELSRVALVQAKAGRIAAGLLIGIVLMYITGLLLPV
jgi:ZIP family zinc transporter